MSNCVLLLSIFSLTISVMERRVTAIGLHKRGMKNSDISKTLGMPMRTVQKAVKRFKELGTTEDRPRSGRPATVTTPEMINKVRCRIRRNSEVSMRKLAKNLKIGRESIRKIVLNKLKLRSYKLGKGHFLDETMKRRRLENAMRLLTLRSFRSILFTDEKIFTIQRVVNQQNDRQLLRNRKGCSQKFLLFLTVSKFKIRKSSRIDISQNPSWYGRELPKLAKHRLFSSSVAWKLTPRFTRTKFLEMLSFHGPNNIFKIVDGPSSRTGHLLIPHERPWIFAERIFRKRGKKIFGRRTRRISIRWTFLFGQFWREKCPLKIMRQLIILNCRYSAHGPKFRTEHFRPSFETLRSVSKHALPLKEVILNIC